jgi:antitoxin component HigA of HigAB toxin-antitoxin module
MANALDPKQLHSESEYRAAVGEMRDLIMADPETPAGRRFDELLRRIEEYEDSHGLAAPPQPTARVKTKVPTLRLI